MSDESEKGVELASALVAVLNERGHEITGATAMASTSTVFVSACVAVARNEGIKDEQAFVVAQFQKLADAYRSISKAEFNRMVSPVTN